MANALACRALTVGCGWQAREREQEEELEAARKEAKAIAKDFNAVRQQRYDAFTVAFEHIASVIDPIFKDLTRSRCARDIGSHVMPMRLLILLRQASNASHVQGQCRHHRCSLLRCSPSLTSRPNSSPLERT